MTPLVRWVLLVALLGRTESVPAQRRSVLDACVALCHAEGKPEGSSGSCHYGELVQQLDERLQGPRGLLRLCLTPCALGNSRQSRKFVFESSSLCRRLRRSILEQQGCICATLRNRKDTDFLGNAPQWIEELIDKYFGVLRGDSYPVDRVTMTILAKHGVSFEDPEPEVPYDQDEESTNVKSVDTDERQDAKEKSEAVVNNILDREDVSDATEAGKNSLDGNQPVSTAAPEIDGTTVADIDWDLWCMAQCEKGQGGSACNCDLIP